MRSRRRTAPESSHVPRDPVALTLAVLAGVGWSGAAGLLATRSCDLVHYLVVSSAPRLWGLLVCPPWQLLLVTVVGGVLAVGGTHAARRQMRRCPAATGWLAAAWVIPLLDGLRLLGSGVPATVWEPLFFCLLTGSSVADIVRCSIPAGPVAPLGTPRRWLAVVWLAAAMAGLWWYVEGVSAYRDYLLGYHDFGHFAYRVANTWEGRGFLMESPGMPAFWDHFNPGLALLAPLWGVWPEARLFLLLQAVCLAAPAPLVFGVARTWGATAAVAAMWAVAYLAYPAVGLMNLNYTYGWHPVSLALPLLFLSVWAVLRGRLVLAAASLILACSFEETLLVTPACLAAVAVGYRWLDRLRRQNVAAEPPAFVRGFAGRLPVWGWLVVWALLAAAFVVIYRQAAFAKYQTARFADLGDSATQIILAPLLRPRAFWGQVCRSASLLFVTALIVPLGWRAVLRGWPCLAALALPVLVLLAWHHVPATSIAFQYVTSFLPVLILAALSGSVSGVSGGRRLAGGSPGPPPGGTTNNRRGPREPLLVGGATALTSCLTAACLFGSVPGTRSSLQVVQARTYPIVLSPDYQPPEPRARDNPRSAGTMNNAVLEGLLAEINRPGIRALATGRIASHLLNVDRLEAVDQAIARWEALGREAGPGRSPVEVFDWIVLDTWEQFQQSPEQIDRVAREARRVGYETVKSDHGLVVLKRP